MCKIWFWKPTINWMKNATIIPLTKLKVKFIFHNYEIYYSWNIGVKIISSGLNKHKWKNRQELNNLSSWSLNHYDFYRLKNSSELYELNFGEAVTDDVCLIEWSDKFEEILPNDRIEISFQIKSKFSRSVKITLRGKFKNQKY